MSATDRLTSRRRGVPLAPLAALALTGCIPAAQGGTAPVHPTIVSLNPCADAILAQVADPAQILALSHYSQDPHSASMPVAEARRFASTRGTVEEVAALHPDVVIDGSFVAPATAGAYARMGLDLRTVGTVRNFEDARAQVREVAAIAGHPKRGEALVARMEAALARAAPPAGAPAIPAVMWESGGMVPGSDTLISDLLRRTGFVNQSAASGYAQADVLPLERLLADPPRVIFTVAAGGEGRGDADRVLSHPALASLVGVTRAAFAPNLLFCGGPTVIAAAARLAEVRQEVAAR